MAVLAFGGRDEIMVPRKEADNPLGSGFVSVKVLGPAMDISV